MAKKSWLPKRVYEYKDRHGKPRYRYVHGFTHHFRSLPGTPEFLAELKECQERTGQPKVANDRAKPGTLDYLCASYYRSQDFNEQGETSRHKNRSVIEHFREERGSRPVGMITFEHLDAIIARVGAGYIDDSGKRRGGKAAAERLRKQLGRLFRHAKRIGMVKDNPMELTAPVKYRSRGHHTWTEAEIEQYQATHPIGTKRRLALEIMLWTGLRVSDARMFGKPGQIRDGRYRDDVTKTGREIWLPVTRQLQQAIDAMPSIGIAALIVTEAGKPFTAKGFSNWFKDGCIEAGLPHCTAHGLRKAFATRLADNEATQQQLKAAGGWVNDREVSTYVQNANRGRLADSAITSLSEAMFLRTGGSDFCEPSGTPQKS